MKVFSGRDKFPTFLQADWLSKKGFVMQKSAGRERGAQNAWDTTDLCENHLPELHENSRGAESDGEVERGLEPCLLW